jgi:heme exporter protein D
MVGELLHLFIICFVYVKVETVGWIDVRLDFKVVTKVARRKKVLDGEMQRKERKWWIRAEREKDAIANPKNVAGNVATVRLVILAPVRKIVRKKNGWTLGSEIEAQAAPMVDSRSNAYCSSLIVEGWKNWGFGDAGGSGRNEAVN